MNAADKRYSYLYPTPKMLKSYAAKIYAVYASPFREVMLLDAGATPFVKPEEFFRLETYTKDRFMEFGDYVDIEKRRWEFLDRHLCVNVEALANYFGGTESDSSCVLLDKVNPPFFFFFLALFSHEIQVAELLKVMPFKKLPV